MTELIIHSSSASHRARVVAVARAWIGTPYHSCADIRGVGVDCGMLLVRVFCDLGLCAPFDPRPYASDWHLHRGEERYLGFVFDRCHERETARPGDVAVFRYGRCYAHGAIVTGLDPLTIVHAYSPAGCVLEEVLATNTVLAAPARGAKNLQPLGGRMSLFRSPGNSSVATPQFTGLQLQTASSALPIPIVYGNTRLAPNLIWSGNFQSHPQYTHTSGGKGGGGSTTVTSYTYSTALVFALGEGPIGALGTVYQGGGLHAASDFYLSLFTGTTPQAPWGYLSSSVPAAALGYQGTAYAASSSFDLGASASIDTIAFEVYGRLSSSTPVNGRDVDPALVIADYLTNAQYGVGFPAASLDATSLYGTSGDGSYQTYCQAMGLAFSPCLSDQESANTTLARWLQITNATAVWSGGRLKILPLGDAPATGTLQGGATTTFVPNTTSVMSLGDDDFVHEEGVDPVIVSRIDPYAVANLQRLEILDRSNQYSATPVEARDQNAIELYGLRIGSTITAHEICDLGVASVSAQLILQRSLYVRNTYAFRLSWDYCQLESMDIVTLTDVGLGLAATPVRITSIAEDSSGLLDVVAEEFPGVVATAQAYVTAGATNTPVNRAQTPAAVNAPYLFEPPGDLTSGIPQIWIGLSGGSNGVADPNWGGAAIYISTDNASYTQVGAVSAPTRQGVLTAALSSPAAAFATDTLSVSFAESGGAVTMVGTTQQMVVVDGEIIGFSATTLTGANTYALGGLQRKLYAMRGGAHVTGTAALILDGAVYKYTLPSSLIGQPLYLKFASVNVFGAAPQDLSTCVAYTITPIGSGLFGPVAQEIALGGSMDDGLASGVIGETDTFGLASDPYTDAIDMGLASDAAASLAVASGGTGATSAVMARQNIGAAASGVNADITSLGALTKIGFASQAITIDPATGHVGLAGYTADSNNGLGVLGTSFLFNAAVDSCRFTFNKAATANDASLTFETGYSARALAGLLGSDGYQLKVSPNGSTFYQVYVADQTTGNLAMKALLSGASYTVIGLPPGLNGAMAFAANGRKQGEGTGAGTGVMVVFSNGQWRRFSDDSVVAA